MSEFVAPLFVFALALPIFLRVQRRLTPWERQVAWASLLAHLVAVYAMIALTRDYYESGDMLSYHRIGVRIGSYLERDFFTALPRVFDLLLQQGGEELSYASGTSTGSMYATAGILCYLLAGSLSAICAVISILTFFAKLSIYQTLRRQVERSYWKPMLLATMLVPSVVFWSSGLLKESLAFIFLGVLVSGGGRLIENRSRFTGLVLLVVGGAGCAIYKAYLLVPTVIAGGVVLYMQRSGRTGLRLFDRPGRFIAAIAATFVLLLLIGSAFPRYDIRKLQEQISMEQKQGLAQEGGSNFQLQDSAPSSNTELTLGAPLAILTALLRPAVIEANNPLALANGLETLVFTYLLIQVLLRRRIRESLALVRRSKVLAFSAVFTIVLALGVGFATTNMGTLSRYRMPLVPFFVTVLVVLGARRTRTNALVPAPARASVLPGQRPSQT